LTQDKTHSFQVMAKPIGPRCNLNCTYCYYLEKERLYPDAKKFGMTDEVLETFIRDYIATQTPFNSPEIWFHWQGGEPTILGIDYFRRVVELEAKYAPAGVTVRNALQTNGTLLTDEWADFLKRNDFLVGLSLDGPKALHDRYRVDRADHATHDKVMAGLALLKSYGVEFNILTVVHRGNSKDPRSVYRFLKETGAKFIQFIPIVERSADGETLAPPPQIDDDGVLYRVTPWSVLPESYGAFLCEVFDEWLREDVGRIFVQFFDSQLGASMGLSAGLCWFSETCGQNLALEHNGDLFACDHYVYPDYKRGNILETSLRALANQPEQLRFGIEKRETLPRQCRDCPVRFSCNGGCPKHRFLKTADGESGLNYFCRSQTRFLRHAGPTLQLMADLIRSGRSAADAMALVKASRRRSGVTALRMEEPQRNSPCPCGSGRKFKVCCGRTDSTNLR